MNDRRSEQVPRAVVADAQGRIIDHPTLQMVAWDGESLVVPRREELVPLPRGSDLFTLPGRLAVTLDPELDEVVTIDDDPDMGPLYAVSAFLAPAWLRLYHPAFDRLPDSPDLSLYAYSAVGWMNGRFYVPAIRVDADKRQDPYRFDLPTIEARVTEFAKRYPDNAAIAHLNTCALTWHCRAAQNFFLSRWEAPLPASSTCNAACTGCISMQPDDSVTASHTRLEIPADPKDLTEIAVDHLGRVPNGVVSFGQGCEGEPLLMGEVLEETIRRIREKTRRGVINLNTNGSLPDVVARLADAGLDAIRLSLNSARPLFHERYYHPKGFSLDQVLQSAIEMHRRDRYVALNYLVFPGVSDTPAELDALCTLIKAGGVDMIQLRNLNIDPELYLDALGEGAVEGPIGLVKMVHTLRDRFPKLRFGYFNPPKTRFGRPGPLPGAKLRAILSADLSLL